MKTSKDLIAYNDLKRRIIDPGFCNLCGACESACPIHALKIENRRLNYTHNCADFMDFCSICYDICPFTEALLFETLGFVANAPNRAEGIGYYRRMLLAQAVDKKLRDLSHSGGVVTALLMHAIKTGFIDSAITSEREKETSIEIRPLLSLVPDDLLSTVDYEYFPSSVAMAFGKAVHEYGKTKIAFVGTPCHVRAIRKLEAWEHKIMNSLRIVIGLTCLWSFSLPELTRFLKERYGIEAGDILRIDMDGKYKVSLKNGKVAAISIPEIKAHTLSICRMCEDFTSELADISVGGAHPLKDWSTVIIRTEIGEEIFEEAVKADVIRTRKIEEEPNVYAHFVRMSFLKRKYATEEVERRKKHGEPVPPISIRLREFLPREINLLSSLKAEHIMTKNVITVTPETTLEGLLAIMTRYHHTGYPIVDDEGKLLGIVTFDDISKVLPSKRGGVLVREVAHSKIVTAHPDSSLMEIYEKMIQHKIGKIIIVDRKDHRKLLGIITKTDIMHVLKWPMKKLV
ncbi:CBS domain-containing protein [Candidatus Bathyarchaeota archaeon]|nr:MAG: CBS domain-containing protein [Candidatus Bathyarchaeota archaeon]